jgi:putative copper resistance protein D
MLEPALSASRFLHYAAAIQLFGAATFMSVISPPSTGKILAQSLRRVATACAVIVVLASLAWLCAVAGTMGNGWADAISAPRLLLVLGGTQFGHVWIAVLGLAVAIVIAMAVPSPYRWRGVAGLSAAMLGALGLIGHLAAAGGWPGIVGRASQIVHLVTVGFWLGSLLPLALCLHATRHSEPGDARAALTNFSGLGHAAVALTLGTGLVNTWIVLGRLPLNVTSPFAVLLVAKVGLVAAMIALALVNRYLLLPRLQAGKRARQLCIAVVAEIAAGALVLIVVSILGTLPPN